MDSSAFCTLTESQPALDEQVAQEEDDGPRQDRRRDVAEEATEAEERLLLPLGG
jgi:hypothetical protein